MLMNRDPAPPRPATPEESSLLRCPSDLPLPALAGCGERPAVSMMALGQEGVVGREGTEPSVDALLLRVIDTSDLDLAAADLDLGADLDLSSMRSLPPELRTVGHTTDSPYDTEGAGQARAGLDTWSVVWYCGMFAAFTSLFLIMPCSQVLCRAGLLHGHSDPRLRPRAPLSGSLGAFQAAAHGYATPPPPYKQFAPPSYEDVILDLGWATPGKAVAVSPLAMPPALLPPMQQQPPEKKDKEGMDAGVGLDVYVIPLRPETSAPSTQAAA
ncbi:CTP-dependent diacylglycerol kinase 1 [Frankliniella fusca]|uniref:CTP-dependent diacylglycerol kinase 1 n=1 Tax=Frankliniella fusca TaxID=407009 RepID=A0AAE1HIB0_9NEOP|nr:CTP-dependent diacylglycerol kinase 1 [Frankliniella fusca]